jgi:hypothetical protein
MPIGSKELPETHGRLRIVSVGKIRYYAALLGFAFCAEVHATSTSRAALHARRFFVAHIESLGRAVSGTPSYADRTAGTALNKRTGRSYYYEVRSAWCATTLLLADAVVHSPFRRGALA